MEEQYTYYITTGEAIRPYEYFKHQARAYLKKVQSERAKTIKSIRTEAQHCLQPNSLANPNQKLKAKMHLKQLRKRKITEGFYIK